MTAMKQVTFLLATVYIILASSIAGEIQGDSLQQSNKTETFSESVLSQDIDSLDFIETGISDSIMSAIGSNLAYVMNKGQWSEEVLFMADGNGFRLWVTESGLVYDFVQRKDSLIQGHVVRMDFDLSQSGYITTKKELPGVFNFIQGNDPSQWVQNVPQFEEIILSELYEGISLRLYGENGMPRYDIIADPGADLDQISFSLEGADNVMLNNERDLSYFTSFGEVKQTDLFTYQVVNGQKQEIASAFSIQDSGLVGFTLGDYNPSLPLVIDPLVYSTFIGISEIPGGFAPGSTIKVEDGYVYTTGITSNTSYPTSVGAYETSFSGGNSIFVTKLNKTGTELLYSTFLGSGAVFTLGDMALEDGYVYLTGTAYAGFPTTPNAYQKNFSDGGKLNSLLVDPVTGEPLFGDIPIFGDFFGFNPTDAFVTKLSLDGGSLVYSTYLGGVGTDSAFGIAVENGLVYITGMSGPQKEEEAPFPTTEGAYQRENGFGLIVDSSEDPLSDPEGGLIELFYRNMTDVFVSKFSADGSDLMFSTLIGGDRLDIGYNIAVKDGKAIISGTTDMNFPLTSDAYMTEEKGGNDVFLLRINESASELEYSTLISSTGEDAVNRMERDGDDLYLLGNTTAAADFPNTPGSYQDSEATFKVPFLMKFANLGEDLVFSTFVGSLNGGITEVFSDLAVERGIPYLTGYTQNLNFFTTENAYQKAGAFQEEYSEDPLYQSFVMRFLPSGENLEYSTLFGGFYTLVNSIAVENGVVYLDGISSKFGFEFSDGAYDNGADITELTDELQLAKKFVTAIDFGFGEFELGAPSLISPANQVLKVPLRPSFSWEPASNPTSNATADYHDFQVSTVEDFSSEVIPRIASADGTLNLNIDLEFGAKYYWRVRGVSTLSTGEWSETFSFISAPSGEGDGTEANPWEIATPEQLHAVRNYLSDHFKVVADIDLSEVTREGGKYWNEGAGWQPIGDGSAPFTGRIAGEGYALEGVFIKNSTDNNVGIFGVIKDGSVKRLAILNPEITGGTAVGSLAALVVGGTIQECYVFEGYVSGDFFVGGLIGVLQTSESLLENCYSYLEIRLKTDPIPSGGGLVGNNQSGIIKNVYSLSTVAGVPVNNGAILGSGNPSPVQSYFNTELAGPDNDKGAGLISAAMRQQASFENWDFINVWQIKEDISFPVLIHNEQIPAPGKLEGKPDANNTLYVDHSVLGGLGNGNSWENAFLKLTEALDWAAINWTDQEAILKIYVAEGVYFPTDYTDASKTFQLLKQVELYGGFESGGSAFESRNWESNKTILSGNIINRDPEIVTNIDFYPIGNTKHVVTVSNTDNSTSLNGFYINAGFALGSADENDGGGIYNSGGSPLLSNLILIGNRSGRYGGGIANDNGANPILSNVIFQRNHASSGGGGMSNLESNPILEHVAFIENISAMNGGGLFNSNSSSPELLNVDFVGNTSNGGAGTGTVGGGGMYSAGGSPILTNVRFSGNMALRNNARGGAILNNTSKTVLTNVTISGNTAYYGGGIYLTQSNNQPEIRNSIIWNNKDNTGIGTANSSLQIIGSVGPQITYSLIQAHDPAGEGNLDGTRAENDPGFVDPILTFGVSPILTGDFRLQSESPAKSKGNQAYFDSGLVPDLGTVQLDLDGNNRFIGGLDLGPYEIQEELEEIIISVLPGQSKLYGTEDLDEFLYESSNNAVSFTGKLGRVAGEDVGTYLITQGSLSAGDNYILIIQEQVFEIFKNSIEGLSLGNQSYVYDGDPQSMTIVGEVPEGAVVLFENNTRTDVGTQEAKATVSGSNFISLLLNGELEVTPGNFTGITFENGTFEFDGTNKSLEVSGMLPEGTSVEFTNNSRTEEGTQEVTATLTGSNYITMILKADLIITESAPLDVAVEKVDPSAYAAMDGSIHLLIDGGAQPYSVTWLQPVGIGPILTELGAGLYQYLVVDAQGLEFSSAVELIHPKSSTIQSEFIADPSYSCNLPFTVNFSDRSSKPEWWIWDFGDGVKLKGKVKNPTHTYTEFGEYTVKLTVQDTTSGETSTSTKIIRVLGVEAEFTSNTTFGCGPLPVQFTDQSQGAGSWLWDFGDGNSSSDQNPAHTYDLPGQYSVKLTTTSENGCIDTEIKSDFIQVIGPKVDFLTDVTAGCGPLTVAFTDKTYSGSPIVSWLWNFGDGTTSRSVNPSHTYTQVGSYSVSLQVSDFDGCSNTLIKSELIRVGGPKISIANTDVSCNGGADGTATVSIEEGTGPFTYEWTPYGGSEASATGLRAGNYEVKVTDGNGCVSIENLTIDQPEPSAITTSAATSISFSSAVLGGSLTSYGDNCETETGIVYATFPNPDLSNSKIVMVVSSDAFSQNVTGLDLNRTYYVKAFSTLLNGETIYGDEISFTTSKKELRVTAHAGQEKIFGEADPSFTFSAQGFEGDDDESILTGDLSRDTGESVGTYHILQGSLDAGENYTINFSGDLFEIKPAAVAGVSFNPASFVFDATEKTLSITGDLLAGTSVTYENNGRTAIGTQRVTATISGDNFTKLVLTADLTITPATVEGITFEDDSFVYDGTSKSLLIKGVLPVETTVEYTNNSRIDVGAQEVTATISGDNFTQLVLTADLTITPATVEGITFEDDSFVFDGTAKSLSITGDLPDRVTVEYTNNSRTDVGTQEVTATISGDNFTELVLTADLTITAAEVTGITFADGSFVFDGTVKSLVIAGDLPLGTSASYTNNGRTDVGTQEVTATITGSNFTTLELKADLMITPATLIVTAYAGQSKEYGEADPVFTYAASGFEAGDDETILIGSLSRTAGENVGNYAINQGTLSAGANYTINFTGANLAITPRTLNVIANPNQAKVYGSSDPVLAYSASNFGNGDTNAILTGALGRTAGENIGMYPIKLGTLSAGSNYSINFTSADFEIAAKVLNVTANAGQTKVFGTADPVLTYTATGFENGDTNAILTGALSRAAGENVGNYAINLGTLSAGANYAINYVGANFTISKATITGISLADGSFVYDGTAKALMISGTLPTGTSVAYTNNSRTDVGMQEVTATISGSNYTTLVLTADLVVTPAAIVGITFEDGSFVYDGTAKTLAITGTLPTGTSVAYTNNSRTDVGMQEVTATISGSNFTSFELKANLEITKASLEIVADAGQSKLYGTADPILTYTATGFGAGDDATILSGIIIRAAGESVGTYVIGIGTLDAGSNYIIDFTGADFEIITNDTDKDGVPDDVEQKDGTDPKDPTDFKDSDGDGVPDFVEDEQGTDPTDGSDFKDTDEDGVPDYVEEQDGTDPSDKSDFSDEDGDGVPSYVEDQNGTDPLDPMDYQDEDGDGVPDYVEDEQGTDPSDPGDYLDTDGDDVPDYVEEQQGTDLNDETDFLDEDGDGVPDYVKDRAVTEYVIESLEVLWGTEAGDLKVPTEVIVITAMGEFINLPVIWDLTGYDPMMSGTTNYMGIVELPAGLFSPDELQPMLEITVLAKPAPQDVTLSANSFIGIPDQYFQEIGAFRVIDPTDNVHMFSLPEGAQDNEYFEVLDGILFWSSAEQAGGRTNFTILLQVNDRAGNVLEKSFQITRQRTPLNQLDVPNTFTPNGDGTNDTWGVLALRYYTGIKISIMSVGGDRVFYTENPDVQWDGVFNGKEMPVGAYLYVIEVGETGEIRRGMLNLLRQ